MSNPIIKIVDVSTGEEIERPMTKDEYETYQKVSYVDPNIVLELKEKQLARQAIAERLGLTADELAILIN